MGCGNYSLGLNINTAKLTNKERPFTCTALIGKIEGIELACGKPKSPHMTDNKMVKRNTKLFQALLYYFLTRRKKSAVCRKQASFTFSI